MKRILRLKSSNIYREDPLNPYLLIGHPLLLKIRIIEDHTYVFG